MADRVAVMQGGQLLQLGTPSDVYENPADLRVATFIGSPKMNVLSAELGEDGEVRLQGIGTGLHSATRGKVSLGVRPEHWHLGGPWQARVVEVEYLGEAALLHARLGDETVVVRAAPSFTAPAGSLVPLGFQGGLIFAADGRRLALNEVAHAQG